MEASETAAPLLAPQEPNNNNDESETKQPQQQQQQQQQQLFSKEALEIMALEAALDVEELFDQVSDIREDSRAAMLAVFDSEEVVAGDLLLRQQGTFYYQVTTLRAISLRRQKIRDPPFDDDMEDNRDRFADRSHDGPFVIKCVNPELLLLSSIGDNKSQKVIMAAAAGLMLEAKILMNLDKHPHIVKLFGWHTDGADAGFSKPRPEENFFLILDGVCQTLPERFLEWRDKKGYASCEERLDDLASRQSQLTQRLEVGLEIASAMTFLSKRQVIYFLHPQKVGFDAKFHQRTTLFDFTTAQEAGKKPYYKWEEQDMARRVYMAPETFHTTTLGVVADVYSFGFLLWETMTLRHPFDGMSREQHLSQVVHGRARPTINRTWPMALQNLIKACWHESEFARPTMADVYQKLEQSLLFTEDFNGIDRTEDHALRTNKNKSIRYVSKAYMEEHVVGISSSKSDNNNNRGNDTRSRSSRESLRSKRSTRSNGSNESSGNKSTSSTRSRRSNSKDESSSSRLHRGTRKSSSGGIKKVALNDAAGAGAESSFSSREVIHHTPEGSVESSSDKKVKVKVVLKEKDRKKIRRHKSDEGGTLVHGIDHHQDGQSTSSSSQHRRSVRSTTTTINNKDGTNKLRRAKSSRDVVSGEEEPSTTTTTSGSSKKLGRDGKVRRRHSTTTPIVVIEENSHNNNNNNNTSDRAVVVDGGGEASSSTTKTTTASLRREASSAKLNRKASRRKVLSSSSSSEKVLSSSPTTSTTTTAADDDSPKSEKQKQNTTNADTGDTTTKKSPGSLRREASKAKLHRNNKQPSRRKLLSSERNNNDNDGEVASSSPTKSESTADNNETCSSDRKFGKSSLIASPTRGVHRSKSSSNDNNKISRPSAAASRIRRSQSHESQQQQQQPVSPSSDQIERASRSRRRSRSTDRIAEVLKEEGNNEFSCRTPKPSSRRPSRKLSSQKSPDPSGHVVVTTSREDKLLSRSQSVRGFGSTTRKHDGDLKETSHSASPERRGNLGKAKSFTLKASAKDAKGGNRGKDFLREKASLHGTRHKQEERQRAQQRRESYDKAVLIAATASATAKEPKRGVMRHSSGKQKAVKKATVLRSTSAAAAAPAEKTTFKEVFVD